MFTSAHAVVNLTFTVKEYRDWKHAAEKDKGLHKNASSKEHLTFSGKMERTPDAQGQWKGNFNTP